MKNKYFVVLFIVIIFMITMSLVACVSEPDLKEFTGITFDDVSVIYDGNEHSIVCDGIPEGATVNYINNVGIEVGVYNASANISMEGYKELILFAKLTIINTPESDISPDDIVIARANSINENLQNYDFKINLATTLSIGAFSGTVNGNYEANYRFNKSTNDLTFKRVTSGSLLYDATEYITGTDSSKIIISADENGLAKKVSIATQRDEGLNLLNIPFAAIVDNMEANNLSNITKLNGNYDYKAKLALASDNVHVQNLLKFIGFMGASIDIGDVSFSNPASGIDFFFNLSEDKTKLTDFKFAAELSFPIKEVDTKLEITYEQKANDQSILIPSIEGIITRAEDIAGELTVITNALESLRESNAYSLDLEATNNFDPGWNNKAIVDKYYSRLYKNTNDGRVDFNHSFEYKAHTEAEGAEKFKYTYGNIEDGTVHLVSRKGTNKVTPAEGITLDSQFNYLIGTASINADGVDCIKKEAFGDTTTYKIYMKNDTTLSIKDRITEIINSNNADGVVDVNNYFNVNNYKIYDSVLVIEMKGVELKSVNVDTKIKYSPTRGDYTEEKITLTNSIKLNINANLENAMKYKAPKHATLAGMGLISSNYYIL